MASQDVNRIISYILIYFRYIEKYVPLEQKFGGDELLSFDLIFTY